MFKNNQKMKFESIIHNDVISIICNFLNPKDILHLYKMYPKIYQKISSVYKKRVAEELDMYFQATFKESYPEFRRQMISTKAIISGSIILQIILGERWPGHGFNRLDIDIFVRVDPIYSDTFDYPEPGYHFYNDKRKFKLAYTDLHNFIYEKADQDNGFTQYVTHSQYMDEFGDNVILRVNDYIIRDPSDESSDQSSDESLESSDEFSNKKKKRKSNIFQIVELNKAKHDSYEQFIEQTVDFDICKNFFCYIDNGFEITIKNILNILNRTTTFNYVHSKKLSEQRKEKYIGRGFTFS